MPTGLNVKVKDYEKVRFKRHYLNTYMRYGGMPCVWT